MAEIQQTRYDQLLRRVAGIIGPGSKVGELITDLLPTFDVENLPGELYKLSGTDLAFGGASITGAAGEFASLALVNPVDSGHLVTITTLIITSDATGLIRFANSATPPTGLETPAQVRDSRQGAVNAPVAQVFNDSLVAGIAAVNRIGIATGVPITLNDANGIAVLAPGTRFVMNTETAAVLLTATFFWRERPAEPSELNF